MSGYTRYLSARKKTRGGSFTWIFQRVTGIFVVVVILFHFCMNHFIGSGEVTYKVVSDRLSDPAWKGFDIGFLMLALYHGLAGVWVVACDYVNKTAWRFLLGFAILIAGAALLYIGGRTILFFPAR